jgi:hypothetical protein
MFKKVSSLFKFLRWFFTDTGMEVHRENVPCADGEHHTAYSLLRSARSREVWTFPEGNFFLLGRENQLLEWAWLRSKGFKLRTDKPLDTKDIPFFTYYGESSMVANMDLVSLLTEEDVAHLSQAEKEFFAWCKKKGEKGHYPQIHTGSRFGPIPTQEEECLATLAFVRTCERETRTVSGGTDLD